MNSGFTYAGGLSTAKRRPGAGHRLPGEIVQRGKAGHHRRERGGNLRIARVGPVLLAVHHVFVDLRVEGLAHRPAVPENSITVRPAATRFTSKALRGEPIGHRLNIRIGGAELLRRTAPG